MAGRTLEQRRAYYKENLVHINKVRKLQRAKRDPQHIKELEKARYTRDKAAGKAARNAAWLAKPETIAHLKEYRRLHNIRTAARRKHAKLKKLFGISIEDYENLLAVQNNVCAICHNPESAVDPRTGKLRNLAVDHCHLTNKVRGLLCTQCNNGLGRFKDDYIVLLAAAFYIKKHNSTPAA